MQEYSSMLDKYVGRKIKDRRKLLGITQAQLAELLSVSHQQVQRYESGENTVSMARALEIAECLNVKINYFYDGANFPTSTIKKPVSGVIKKDPNRILRILLVENSTNDELLFRQAVNRSKVNTDLYSIQNSESVMDYLINHDTKYSSEKPDIVILDTKMPRLSGISLLKKIKNTHQLKNIPVIMLTNSVRSKDMLDAYANYASSFIQKNSDLFEFYEEINLLLEYWSKVVILPNSIG